MASTALSPVYDPSAIETDIYRRWLKDGLFTAGNRMERHPYVIVIPPPNVTSVLHMGHGLNNTIQDVLIRFERMRGCDALWLPGTDHAGIATQNVVERMIAKEGRTRHDLGREAFVERVWSHVRETGSSILDQLKAIGASCDWSRTRFTLDDGLSRAVRDVFVRLYHKNLIYRGNYIINWCPRCLTALSNEEAEKHDLSGNLWHIRYPLAGADDQSIVVATTRPETMLGDTAVAVHPDDDRYRQLVGKQFVLPLTGRTIPVIEDSVVDRKFGTGAVKVTPAHDPVDFEIASRHGLQILDVMTDDAQMSENAPSQFQGLDRFEARRAVVRALEEGNYLVKVESHLHRVGHCYRCDTVVEPRLSEQWFVRMRPLAEPALDAYRKGRVRFVPERRGDDYERWMVNIRDWCISRQLWWGHRIPAWYCDDPSCEHVTVASQDPDGCEECGGSVHQDEDVLDTWFSSWLWPFSTLGWPEKTLDLERYYPGSTLVTSPDILFFWVTRMIMAGIEFMGDVPFRTVFIHGVVRDTQHRRMAKSLGNGIDPLDVVEQFGADALRFSIIAGSAIGTDVTLDPNDLRTSFASGRNFANKLWNAGRFILTNLEGPALRLSDVDRGQLELADRWILSRTQQAVVDMTEALHKFRLNDAANRIYHFIWNELADWYIEQVKPRLYGSEPGGDVARAALSYVFSTSLRLLHPIMPFITEELWQNLPEKKEELVAEAEWPEPDPQLIDEDAEERFGHVQALVGAVRTMRAEARKHPGEKEPALVVPASASAADAFSSEKGTIQRLANLSHLDIAPFDTAPASERAGRRTVLPDGSTAILPQSEQEIDKERARLGAEIERLEKQLARVSAKLSTEAFLSKAPPSVVQREREKERVWREQRDKIVKELDRLGS